MTLCAFDDSVLTNFAMFVDCRCSVSVPVNEDNPTIYYEKKESKTDYNRICFPALSNTSKCNIVSHNFVSKNIVHLNAKID